MITIDFHAAAATPPVTRLIRGADGYQRTYAAIRCCDGWGYTTPEWSGDALDPRLIPSETYETADQALDACTEYLIQKEAEYQKHLSACS